MIQRRPSPRGLSSPQILMYDLDGSRLSPRPRILQPQPRLPGYPPRLISPILGLNPSQAEGDLVFPRMRRNLQGPRARPGSPIGIEPFEYMQGPGSPHIRERFDHLERRLTTEFQAQMRPMEEARANLTRITESIEVLDTEWHNQTRCLNVIEEANHGNTLNIASLQRQNAELTTHVGQIN